jgi:hypothetical protein
VYVTTQEVVFFAIIYAVTVAAAVARGLRDSEYLNYRHAVNSCLSSGFFSLGIVSVWIYSNPGSNHYNAWYWIGIAALLGMLGKEQDKFLRLIVSGILKGFRIVIEDTEKKQ